MNAVRLAGDMIMMLHRRLSMSPSRGVGSARGLIDALVALESLVGQASGAARTLRLTGHKSSD
jgi:hypothetical protein